MSLYGERSLWGLKKRFIRRVQDESFLVGKHYGERWQHIRLVIRRSCFKRGLESSPVIAKACGMNRHIP